MINETKNTSTNEWGYDDGCEKSPSALILAFFIFFLHLLYIYNDLGQILECGFNLASKKITLLLERACVAR